MNKIWWQRLFGLLLIFLSIFSCYVCDGDATFAVVGIPAGLAIIFSNKEIIGGNYDEFK